MIQTVEILKQYLELIDQPNKLLQANSTIPCYKFFQKNLQHLFQLFIIFPQSYLYQFKSTYYKTFRVKMQKDSNKIVENRKKFKKSLQLTLFGNISEINDSSIVENTSYFSNPQIAILPIQKSISMNSITNSANSTFQLYNESQDQNGFHSKYILGKKIQEGTQGVVYKCFKRETNQLMAVKIMKNCQEQTMRMIQKLYNSLHTIQHQSIIETKDLFINQQLRTIYLVMQYCNYSNLRELLIKKGVFEEKQIKFILRKILKALQYLHRKGICHRDLKPENILCSDDLKTVKIIDFEISRQKNEENQTLIMMTDTGTLNYRAPESFTGFYGKEIDIWAFGIIFFQLLTGKTPFSSQYQKQTIRKVKYSQLQLQNTVSSSGKILLRKLLQKNPTCRITAQEAIKDQYFLNFGEFVNKDDTDSEAQTLDEFPVQMQETLQVSHFQ